MICYIANNDIVNYIKQYGISVQPYSAQPYFSTSNIDDEFLSLLKLKFGNKIKTYSEICNEIGHAYEYARLVMKGRFPDGEVVIATDAEIAYEYAKNIIKGRFPEGETAIASVPAYSYYYAKYALHKRFTLGEAAIKKDSHNMNLYEKHFNITL